MSKRARATEGCAAPAKKGGGASCSAAGAASSCSAAASATEITTIGGPSWAVSAKVGEEGRHGRPLCVDWSSPRPMLEVKLGLGILEDESLGGPTSFECVPAVLFFTLVVAWGGAGGCSQARGGCVLRSGRLKRKQFGVPQSAGSILFAEASLVSHHAPSTLLFVCPPRDSVAHARALLCWWRDPIRMADPLLPQRKRFVGRGKYCMLAIWDDQQPERCAACSAFWRVSRAAPGVTVPVSCDQAGRLEHTVQYRRD